MKKHKVPLVEYVGDERVVVGECEIEYDQIGVIVTLEKLELPEDIDRSLIPLSVGLKKSILGDLSHYSIADKVQDGTFFDQT